MRYTNTHIHTPYSFSAFESIDQAVRLARDEQISVLGISDFNTMEGFSEFSLTCEKYAVHPLYNIEFICFSEEDKQRNLRWNDPKNPGIIYFCGKALSFPSPLSNDSRNLLGSLWKGTQDNIWKVIHKVNEYLQDRNIDITLDYHQIRCTFAKNTVRERHVAKALYVAMSSKWDSAGLPEAFRILFNDPSFSGPLGDSAFMQNEIRDRLLKAGKPAYIEERPEAFLSLPVIRSLILEAGGIPCYPVLADEKSGLTEYENDPSRLADRLIEQQIYAVEFIPLRNGLEHLRNYVRVFRERGFCVTFGTEHNTPSLIPLLPSTRGGVPFDEELLQVAYEGACILAAHQEQRRLQRQGFLDELGIRAVAQQQLRDFIRIGDQAIQRTANASVTQVA
jgi:hypothetical protein